MKAQFEIKYLRNFQKQPQSSAKEGNGNVNCGYLGVRVCLASAGEKGRSLFTCHTDSCFRDTCWSQLIIIPRAKQRWTCPSTPLSSEHFKHAPLQTQKQPSPLMSLSKNEFCSIAFKPPPHPPFRWILDGDVQETDFEHEKSSCVVWYSPLSSGCHTFASHLCALQHLYGF